MLLRAWDEQIKLWQLEKVDIWFLRLMPSITFYFGQIPRVVWFVSQPLRHCHANYPNRRSNTTVPLVQPLLLPTTPPSSESPIPTINYFASSEPKIRSPSMLQDVGSGMTVCIGSPRKSFDMPRQRSTASHWEESKAKIPSGTLVLRLGLPTKK
jgi:hypothetical protein